MSKKDEALKLALELKNSASAYWTEKEILIIEKLIKLLALAEQPAQQEPFGYFRYDLRLDAWVQNRAGLTGTPFYTSPPAQQNTRNATLDEIATKIGAMPFGDTAASFAVWIREQKT